MNCLANRLASLIAAVVEPAASVVAEAADWEVAVDYFRSSVHYLN